MATSSRYTSRKFLGSGTTVVSLLGLAASVLPANPTATAILGVAAAAVQIGYNFANASAKKTELATKAGVPLPPLPGDTGP